VGHTGFLVTARRLADGVQAPPRRRRPSKGAQAADDLAELAGGEMEELGNAVAVFPDRNGEA
jgi:tRNA (adenine57-N1/adenine58-N1)-methyltransferase